jgi:hypothetical protein
LLLWLNNKSMAMFCNLIVKKEESKQPKRGSSFRKSKLKEKKDWNKPINSNHSSFST